MKTLLSLILYLLFAAQCVAQSTAVITVRGKSQTVHLYGSKEGRPVVLSSGDGGWIHLAVHVAEFLGPRNCFIVGVDAKAYLSSFTAKDSHLQPADVPKDYRAFADYARHGRNDRALLIGVSEGAGLSLLAAADSDLQKDLLGVVTLGLTDQNELAWRFRDSIIWITKGTPNEPTFLTRDYIPKLGNTPLADIHSAHDEFYPVEEARKLMNLPGGHKQIWVIDAADHRFSNKLGEFDKRLIEAIDWVDEQNR